MLSIGFQLHMPTICLLGILYFVLGIVSILTRSLSLSRQVGIVAIVLGLVTFCFHFIWIEEPKYGLLLAGFLIPGLLLALLRSNLPTRFWQQMRTMSRGSGFAAGAFLLAGVVLIVLTALQAESSDVPILEEILDELEGSVRCSDEDTVASALTDRGRTIPLLIPAQIDLERNQRSNQRLKNDPFHLSRLIQTGPATPHVNCHGWVFSEGRYTIRGSTVETILTDNGYEQTSLPHIGDLVVYRCQENSVLHTGIVRLAMENGQRILIESKWGALGTYLHFVEHSPYGNHYRFYRSNRPHHRLDGIAPVDTTSPSSGRMG